MLLLVNNSKCAVGVYGPKNAEECVQTGNHSFSHDQSRIFSAEPEAAVNPKSTPSACTLRRVLLETRSERWHRSRISKSLRLHGLGIGFVALMFGIANHAVLAAGRDIPEGKTHPLLASLPNGCHAQQRPDYVLVDDSPEMQRQKLPEIITKTDVLCVGSEVIIDRPIYTGGGNVLIYAQHLRIERPIDTRPYFARSPERFFIRRVDVPDASPETFGLDEWFSGFQDPYYHGLWLAIRDYYLRCYDSIVIDGVAFCPELLGGLSQLKGVGQRDTEKGIPAPERLYDVSAIRSGDIEIVAGQLTVAVPPSEIPASPSPLDCHSPRPNTQHLLNVSGARGARGGLGTDFDRPFKATNSPGGAGADAGSIRITLLESASDEIRDALKRVSRIRGGPPGARERIATFDPRPGWHRPGDGRGVRHKDVCTLIFKEPWPSARGGQDGALTIANGTSLRAMRIVSSWVRSHDSLNYYDFDELATRAKSARGMASIGFQDFLESRLTQILADAQTKLATDLLNVMVPQAIAPSRRAVFEEVTISEHWIPPVFDLSGRDIVSEAFDRRLIAAFVQLLPYASGEEEATQRIVSYFVASGGLLNSPTGSYDDSSHNQQLMESVRKSNENELRIADGVNGLRLEAHRLRVFVQRNALESRLAALRERLAEAQRNARVNGLELLGKQLGIVSDRANEAADAYQKLKSRAAAGPDSAELILHGIGFYGKLGSLGASMIGLFSLDYGDSSRRIQEEMRVLEREIQEFDSTSRKEREGLNEESLAVLRDLLQARRGHARQMMLRTVSFEYLLRRFLILHQLDAARRPSVLIQNLNQLLSYSKGDVVRFVPDGDLRGECPLLDRPLDSETYRVQAGCIYWERSERDQIFWGPLAAPDQSELGAIPLFVVSAGVSGESGRPLFTFRVDSVSSQ